MYIVSVSYYVSSPPETHSMTIISTNSRAPDNMAMNIKTWPSPQLELLYMYMYM